MKTEEEAVELAKTMVQIGRLAKRETVALVTDMNQPLGRAVGNALEVKEAILTLRGQGPARLTELCLELAAEMLLLANAVQSRSEARRLLEESLQSGKALHKFKELIEAQGGQADVADDLSLLPQAAHTTEAAAPAAGYVQAIDPLIIGISAMELGAGREHKDSVIDLAVGIELKAEIGDYVEAGMPLATIYANDPHKLREAAGKALQAFQIGDGKPALKPTIYRKITAEQL